MSKPAARPPLSTKIRPTPLSAGAARAPEAPTDGRVSGASRRLRALAALSGSLTDALQPEDAASLVEQKALSALGERFRGVASLAAERHRHLSAAAFTTMANIEVIHAPYRGSAPAMTDLLGGHISFMFDSMGTAITHINANTVRPLAVSGPERSSLLPEVPTFAELGLNQGYNVTAWFGFHVSSGTPTEIIDRLSQAMKTVSENSEFVETFRRQGVDIISSTPAEYAEFLRQEDEKLGSLIKQANITLD